jgi:hypothetical protein
MSALAIVSLARQSLLLRSFSAPMELVLAAYTATMGALLGWAERSLQGTLAWIGGFIEWRPTLYLHWRDMLVVVAIWSSALVWARWRVFAARWSTSAHDGMFGLHCLSALDKAPPRGLWFGLVPPLEERADGPGNANLRRHPRSA